MLIGVMSVLLAAVQWSMVSAATPPATIALFLTSVWIFIAAGLLAWWRRPGNGMGMLIVLGGLALWLGSLASTGYAPLNVVGLVFETSVLAVLVHLLHAFPSGRLRGGFSTGVVIAGYVVAIGGQVPLYLLSPSPISTLQSPSWFGIAVLAQQISGALVMVLTSIVLADRLRRADPAHRRRLLPLYAYGIIAILFIPLSSVLFRLAPVPDLLRGMAQIAVVTGVPIAFSIAVIRGGFARTGVIEELAARLGTVGPDRFGVTAALAEALGDPSVHVVYRSAAPEGYTDEDGHILPAPTTTADRAVAQIELDGRVVGAIVYDSRMIADAS
ncbi:MAG TPA: ATPase, partial [Microbacterium sp.]|nr:ATPase [Microbacterium sp.]